jgi:hypothetical protein
MADGAITVTIDDAGVRAGLAKLVGRLAHMAPVMEDIGRALGNLTEDAFQAQWPGWPALRPVTVKRRQRGADPAGERRQRVGRQYHPRRGHHHGVGGGQ